MQTGGFAAMQRENHPLEGRFRPGDAALHGMVDGAWWEPTLSAMGACPNPARCRGIADKVGLYV